MSLQPENIKEVAPIEAAEDLSAAEGKLAVLYDDSGTAKAKLAATSGTATFGVIVEPAALGKAVGVAKKGTMFATAKAGTYTTGDELTADATGVLVKTTTSGHYISARAMEGTTLASDGLLLVELVGPYKY